MFGRRVKTPSNAAAFLDDRPEPPARSLILRPAAALLFLLVLAAGACLFDPTGWLGSDDAGYYAAAEHLRSGTPIQRVHHHYARLPVIAAIAASTALLGDNVPAVILPSVIAYLATVILVAALGWIMWGWPEALLAAGLVAWVPYFRLLSTTAYPDVPAVFWATLAMLLTLAGMRAGGRRAYLWGLAAGVCVGLGVSTKVFTGLVAVPILFTLFADPVPRRTRMAPWLLGMACGIAAALATEGLVYARFADDFFFHFHALGAARGADDLLAQGGPQAAGGWFPFIRERLTMPLRPAQSGWSRLGAVFLPAALIALADRKARVFAVWGLTTYLLVAFAPVSLRDGYRPYPLFHGRHVLPAVVPFMLCVAWLARKVLVHALGPRRASWSWPVALTALGMALILPPSSVGAQKRRHTAQVGRAVALICTSNLLGRDAAVFMTPSAYWRFRILCPPDVRARLRVSADPDAPGWWRYTTVDVQDRAGPLPRPGTARLLVTPKQLRGEAEHWDYGVTLPRNALQPWQSDPATVICAVPDDEGVVLRHQRAGNADALLLLLGSPSQVARAKPLTPPIQPQGRDLPDR